MFDELLERLGLRDRHPGVCSGPWSDPPGGEEIVSINPSTGEPIATVVGGSIADYDAVADRAVAAFKRWRTLPAPRRGEAVRRIGQALREHKDDLGMLVTLEVGKIRSEGLGEVQEMIDMADFAVGLSRQLYGLTIASERPGHRMFEQWHPIGPVGIISAFNFPVAVWSWNAMVAAVCGDSMVWKPSPLAPLTSVAVQRLVNRAVEGMGIDGVFGLCVGGADLGRRMAEDDRLPLISATGSVPMGRAIAPVVAARLGRSLLELGGNNGIIVSPKANLDLALRAVVFAAVGTAGQRCTTLRRLIIHESIADGFLDRLASAYRSLRVGDPWEDDVLVGPLISEQAVASMLDAIEQAKAQGGEVVCGGNRLDRPGYFVEPTLIRANPGMPIVRKETFAPILFAMTYSDLDEAIALHNDVAEGLSSAIVTDDLREAERFLSPEGSDCGIANVNIGTSGAEIGGAFGGEKATGGGREAGSDAWKAYMRRQTCTVNFGGTLPLAQGVRFDLAP
ncbi:L-piperidine-6-carboxylate dehydrogenase [Tautonia sociabilis]|uniref:Aldehyde dehydrogenase family protein n=1 Tax=Tautonia sociabilis TaxID=2080755 RepID=A0A432MDC5_9BACT|nr:aldehyde dehydrogenase family protein [Tautonia sociabilis]